VPFTVIAMLEHDTYIAPANTPASTITAALRDHKRVRVTGDQSWSGGIVLPEHRILSFEAPHYVFRASAGAPLITQLSFSSILGSPRFQANGHAGTCVYVPSGANFTKMSGDIHITNWIGVCVDMSEPTSGHECNIEGLLANRTDPSLPAIVLPVSEVTTRGIRRFEDCQAGGARLIDVGGSNLTQLQNCTTFGFTMNDNCNNLKTRDCRFAYHAGQTMQIKGWNHCFRDNHVSAPVTITGGGHVVDQYDAGRTLTPGSSQCVVYRYPTCAYTVDQGIGNMVMNR
jgi:hypothetical protein